MSALCSLQESHAGAGNDYQKDQQFKKLNAARASYDVKVLRGGANVLVPNTGPHLPTCSWLACDTGPGSDVMHAALQNPWDVRSLATPIRAAIVEADSKLAAWIWQASMASQPNVRCMAIVQTDRCWRCLGKDLQKHRMLSTRDEKRLVGVSGAPFRLWSREGCCAACASEPASSAGVVVGDVLILDTGDKVVADGVLLETHGMVIDEASLTGESEPVRKNADDVWCRSGTQVG